jgi:hypothetical protein
MTRKAYAASEIRDMLQGLWDEVEESIMPYGIDLSNYNKGGRDMARHVLKKIERELVKY